MVYVKNRKKGILSAVSFVLIWLLSFLNSSFADTIKLKSGKIVEGRIVERTDDYVRINFYGVDLKYYQEQIDSINKAEARPKLKIIKPVLKPEVITSEIEKRIFRDEKWRYFFEYPSTWDHMPESELKEIMIVGFKPKGDSLVTIQLQAGNFTEADTSGKATLADLLDIYLKPTSELKREFVKPITLRYESGYLIRYTLKSAQVVYDAKGIEGPLYVPTKMTFDYYFFSPVFSSEGKDRRAFLVELSYVEFDEVSPEVDSEKNRSKIYQWNAYYKDKNRKIENRCWEAREIINSFRSSE